MGISLLKNCAKNMTMTIKIVSRKQYFVYSMEMLSTTQNAMLTPITMLQLWLIVMSLQTAHCKMYRLKASVKSAARIWRRITELLKNNKWRDKSFTPRHFYKFLERQIKHSKQIYLLWPHIQLKIIPSQDSLQEAEFSKRFHYTIYS